MPTLPPSAKLSKPTHKIVGPDGVTEYFLISVRGANLRIRILYDAPNWVDTTPKGSISTGYGPSGADDITMGRWTGILAYHFTSGAIDLLPDGAHCVEVNPAASTHDYQTQILWSGWEAAGMASYPAVSLARAKGSNYGSMHGLPVTRPQVADARARMLDHLELLRSGEYRNHGEAYTPEVLAEFIRNAKTTLAYCDFLDSIAPMPERPRERPATDEEQAYARMYGRFANRPEERAYYIALAESGVYSAPARKAAFTRPGHMECC